MNFPLVVENIDPMETKSKQNLGIRWMRCVIELMGQHAWLQRPFFGLGFFTIRLVYPLQYLLLRHLIRCERVLDLGCGRHSMVPIIPKRIHTVGVELFESAFQEANASRRHSEVILGDITKVEFKKNEFDAVMLSDVLEHLTKDEGRALLKKAENWAREKVIVFTPNGYLHQDTYDGNPLMAHKSGWTVSEFRELGFKVNGVRGFKSFYPSTFRPDESASTFWTRLLDLGQMVTYDRPSAAYQLFCVKEIHV